MYKLIKKFYLSNVFIYSLSLIIFIYDLIKLIKCIVNKKEEHNLSILSYNIIPLIISLDLLLNYNYLMRNGINN